MNALATQPKSRAIQYQFYSCRNLAPASVRNYTNAVRGYVRFLEDNRLEMGFESVQRWLGTIENARTHNVNLQGVKAYLLKRFESEPAEKLLELERGFKKIKRKKPKVYVDDSKFITLAEFETLTSVDTLEKLRPYIRKRHELSGYTDVNIMRTVLFIKALFWTGCRISELLDIKVKDCAVLDAVNIRIRNGKGGKERLVFLPRDVFAQVRKVFRGETYLFETRKGTRFDRLNVTKEIHRFAKKIVRRNLSAHSMRHSKAMYLKDVMGLSPDQVAKALGHSSVVTTLAHYYHGTPDARAQGVA
ncbi:MAG TPA: site-specific integrase [Spirochaetota bacterium]|nr:site-specific integrase [Spirochaetota bacterium]